jgi:NAD(P)-dependent dehydrogenase (short-subunit alcohol dehydrogenase family)
MSTILITGAARRIGEGIARFMATCGYDLILHYHTSEDKAQILADELKARYGINIHCVQADLTQESGADDLFDVVEALGLPMDTLINNASLFEPDTLETLNFAQWSDHMMIHTWSPARLTQRFAEYYKKMFPHQRSGNVIHMIDQRVKRLTPHFFSYTASKSLLWSMTQTMAMSLAPFIRVNGIAPGPTLPNPRQSAEDFTKQFQNLPLQRSIDLEEIAKAIDFLIKSPSMTGNLLMIDSGQHLAWETPDVVGIQE